MKELQVHWLSNKENNLKNKQCFGENELLQQHGTTSNAENHTIMGLFWRMGHCWTSFSLKNYCFWEKFFLVEMSRRDFCTTVLRGLSSHFTRWYQHLKGAEIDFREHFLFDTWTSTPNFRNSISKQQRGVWQNFCNIKISLIPIVCGSNSFVFPCVFHEISPFKVTQDRFPP